MSVAHSSPAASRRRWLIIGLAVLAIALLAWWLWPSSPAKSPQPGGRPGFGAFSGPVPVRVTTVKQGEFEVFYKALGTVTPLNTVNVRSRVGGELVEVRFEEGQRVKAGELLAVIDPRPYKVALQQAEGTLQQNRALLQNAQVRSGALPRAVRRRQHRQADARHPRRRWSTSTKARWRPIRRRSTKPSLTWNSPRSAHRSTAASACASWTSATWSRPATPHRWW